MNIKKPTATKHRQDRASLLTFVNSSPLGETFSKLLK